MDTTNKEVIDQDGRVSTLINGDSAEVLKTYPDNHFDSVVTDPP